MTFEIKDSGKREEYTGGMVRDITADKIDYTLVLDGPMFQRWVEHMTNGAKKYEKRNWMRAKGKSEKDRFRESAFRHFMQWYNGEVDEDHAAAVFFNINGVEYIEVNPETKAAAGKGEKEYTYNLLTGDITTRDVPVSVITSQVKETSHHGVHHIPLHNFIPSSSDCNGSAKTNLPKHKFCLEDGYCLEPKCRYFYGAPNSVNDSPPSVKEEASPLGSPRPFATGDLCPWCLQAHGEPCPQHPGAKDTPRSHSQEAHERQPYSKRRP